MVEIIKQLAKEKGISLVKLEEMCGLPITTISRWDTRMPSADKLARVSSVLGVSTQKLLGMEEIAPIRHEELIEDAFKRPQLRTLFSLANEAPDEDIEYVIRKLEKLKG